MGTILPDDAVTGNHRTFVAGVFFWDGTEAGVGVVVAVVGLVEELAPGCGRVDGFGLARRAYTTFGRRKACLMVALMRSAISGDGLARRFRRTALRYNLGKP